MFLPGRWTNGPLPSRAALWYAKNQLALGICDALATRRQVSANSFGYGSSEARMVVGRL